MKKQIIVLIIIALLTLIFVNLKNENSQEKIIIPVVAHQIMDPSGQYTTSRSEDNIKETINEANRIWSQANIEFQLREIRQDNVSFNAIPSALTGNHMELYNTLNFNPDEVNVFFAGTLTGLNGLTLVKINSVLITDNPTSSGGRALAHELGHILNLIHLDLEDNLMKQGRRGEVLIPAQIEASRSTAKELF